MQISITREKDNARQTWSFYFADDLSMRLSEYRLETKEGNQRKFRVVQKFDSMFQRYSTLERHEVPMDESIKQEVIRKLVSSITWKE